MASKSIMVKIYNNKNEKIGITINDIYIYLSNLYKYNDIIFNIKLTEKFNNEIGINIFVFDIN